MLESRDTMLLNDVVVNSACRVCRASIQLGRIYYICENLHISPLLDITIHSMKIDSGVNPTTESTMPLPSIIFYEID